MLTRLFSLVVFVLALTACAAPAPAGPQISLENAWARPSAGLATAASPTPDMAGRPAAPEGAAPAMPGMSANGPTSAVYFVIVNQGSAADTLTGASCAVASAAQLHQTRMQGDVAEMAPVPSVEVPAHGKVEFKPGGYHVMLLGLARDLNVGDTLKLTLQFEKSGAITLDVPVRMGQ